MKGEYKSKIVSRVFVIVIALIMMLPVSVILPGQVNAETPNEQFLVHGMVYTENMTPIDGAKVMVRNMETGELLTTTAVDGYYEINLTEMPNGVSIGDFIVVEADDGSSLGAEDFVVEAGISEKNIDIVIFGTSPVDTLSSFNPTNYTPDVVALSRFPHLLGQVLLV